MLLIGITGRAGSGKDTVGAILQQHGFEIVYFSYRLKRMISGLLREPIDLWDDREWRETVHELSGQTPRYMAQTLGTEWGRQKIHPNLWIIDTWNYIQRNNFPLVAITDVRFENEADMIRAANGGHIIHVERPCGSGKIATADHVSEAGIEVKAEDFIIVNDGSLEDLESKVDDVLRRCDERMLACRSTG